MRSGEPILVAAVGEARGARAAAAALACGCGGEAGLLVDVGGEARPRPGLLATAAARALEDRIAAHLPDAGVASRGRICVVSLGEGAEAVESLGGALAIGRDALCVVHVEPPLLRAAIERTGSAGAALLRADVGTDRALVALASADLIRRGLRVGVLKRPLGWVAARLALAGATEADGLLPRRLVDRLLDDRAVA